MAVRRHILRLLGVILLLTGCRTAHQMRDPEYADVVEAVHQALHGPDPVSPAMSPIHSELEGPHTVEEYIQVALDQNPDIQAARKRIEAFAHQVPVAASLQDPMLGMTAFPEQVQTAAGAQEFLLSASQKVPWFGKRRTRAEVAEAQTNMARAQFSAVELETVEKVKRAYYELYFVQQAIVVTQAEQELLVRIRKVAETRYKTVGASQQDLLLADLEVSNVENELIRLRQRLDSAQARLARVLHIAPQTKLRAMDRLRQEQLPDDLERLQRLAVDARPELHAQLAALEGDRQRLELARLDYRPDVTFGATWIDVSSAGLSAMANGRDSFLVGASFNVPLHRKRLDSSVRSAEAKAVSSARQYDSLRDATLEEVMDLFVQTRSQRDLLILLREDILPKARLTLEVSNGSYSVGEVDFPQLIDNWRQLLRYEISYHRLEASLRQTLAKLERTVGGITGPPIADCQYCAPPPLPYAHYEGCVCHSCAVSKYLSILPPPVEQEADSETDNDGRAD